MDKKILMAKIGFVILSIGVYTADTKYSVISAIVAIFGAYLVWRGSQDVE